MNTDTPTNEPFGAALLRCMRAEALPLGELTYDTIQELKLADRTEAIRILRGTVSAPSYNVLQMLKSDEPEEIARALAAQYLKTTQLLFVAVLLGS